MPSPRAPSPFFILLKPIGKLGKLRPGLYSSISFSVQIDLLEILFLEDETWDMHGMRRREISEPGYLDFLTTPSPAICLVKKFPAGAVFILLEPIGKTRVLI